MNIQDGAENYSGDVTATTEVPAVEEQTAEDGFLSGFEAEDLTREQVEAESDSKDSPEDAKDTINKQENTGSHRSGRAEKRIRQLRAQNQQYEAELAEYRKWKAEQDKPELKTDEDGNATPEDFVEYNRQLISQEIARAREEDNRRYEDAIRERDLDNSIHVIKDGIAERVSRYDFLNPQSNSYNPQAEQIISQTVLEQIQQLQAIGMTDYSEMAELALEYVDRQINLFTAASSQVQANTISALDSMRNDGAIVSSNHGTTATQDDFEAVFSS